MVWMKLDWQDIHPPKPNILNPKIMDFGKCISGFKHGVILGIYVRCRGANENGDAIYLER